MLLFLLFLIAPLIFAQPKCSEPPPKHPPIYSDCEQIIRLIEEKAIYTRDPLLIVSRTRRADIRLPIFYNAAVSGNTCAIGLDMVRGREDAAEVIRLSNVAYAAQSILEECLAPRLLAPATQGWMVTGRYAIVNVTLGRARVALVRPHNKTHVA